MITPSPHSRVTRRFLRALNRFVKTLPSGYRLEITYVDDNLTVDITNAPVSS